MPASPLSRWRTGTLAAAGTIPVTAVTAPATLVRSKGHHPAKHRPAIPTRAYESGSGGSRHAAPVRHLHPPRPPPATAHPAGPALTARLSAPGNPRQGRLRRRCASAPRPYDPARRSHDLAAIRAWAQPSTPSHLPGNPGINHQTTATPARTKLRTCKDLTQPLHMSRERISVLAPRAFRSGSPGRLREPVLGATVFRFPQTMPDYLGVL